MKTMKSIFTKVGVAIMIAAATSYNASATVFTAVLSGNFNSVVTWGGAVPGTIVSSDIIIIPAGITVTLNSSAAFSGSSSLTVNGSLVSGSYSTALRLNAGSLAGSGNIIVDSLTLGLTSGLTFTGSLAADHVVSTGATISTGASIVARNTLMLNSGTLNFTAGDFTIGNGGNITLNGGSFTSSGSATMHLDSNYSVSYLSAATTGVELTGSGLNNVTVNSSGVVTLNTNSSVNGNLSLTSGTLSLNGYSLTLGSGSNLIVSGSGGLSGSTSSNLIINSSASLSSALTFVSGGNTLRNLTINTGGTASLGSSLNINGTLALSSGNLSLNGHTLTLNSAANLTSSGSAAIAGSTTSDITILSASSLTGGLTFTGSGNTLRNLTINMGSGATANLGSSLNIAGTLALSNGTLHLNGHGLTLGTGANLTVAGSGALGGSSSSDLAVTTSGSVSTAIPFATSAATLRNLTVNLGTSSGSVMLGSGLTVNGNITLTSGNLNLNGNSLTIGSGGNLSLSGTSALTGSATSDLAVMSSSSLSSALNFTTGGNTLRNLTINTGSSATTTLGDNLTVNGTLALSNGTLALNGNSLTLGTGSNLTVAGTGAIAGSSTSDITILSTGSLTGGLTFTGSGNTLRNLTVNMGSGATVNLGSSLNIAGTLALSNGTLHLNGRGLTLGSSANLTVAGTGALGGNSTSDLAITTSGSLSTAIPFATSSATLRNLTVNLGTGSGSVMLGSGLTINGNITLTSGNLNLNGNPLTIGSGGNLSLSGTSALTGSATSDLAVMTSGSLSSALRFTTGGNTLRNLTINTGGSATTTLGDNLTVNGTLSLSNGTLALNGNSLTLGAGSNLTVAGSGAIAGGTTSDITILSTGSLTGGLTFTGSGNTLRNLTINMGSGATANLGSSLNIAGTLALSNGTLHLNGRGLTLGSAANLTVAGSGALGGNSTSDLAIMTSGGISSALIFTTGGNILRNLTINTGSSATTRLGSNLNVNGTLALSNGTFALNGNSLTLGTGSNMTVTATGAIAGSNTSDITILSNSSLLGGLTFTASGNTLRNLTINMGSGAYANMGSSLNIAGTLSLLSGNIRLGGSNLKINAGGNISGGSSTSYVAADGTGKLAINLAAGQTGNFKIGTVGTYIPMDITANPGSASGDVSINVTGDVYSGGASGTSLSATKGLVKATWFVSSTATTGINYDMKAMWSASLEVNGFDRTHAYISHNASGAWDAQTGSASGMSGSLYTISRTGITSLSPFMVTDKNFDDTATGVKAVNAGSTINVYPNPATSVLYISAPATIHNAAIYNMSGQIARTTDIVGNSITIDDLPMGVYTILLTGENMNVTKTFVKK